MTFGSATAVPLQTLDRQLTGVSRQHDALRAVTVCVDGEPVAPFVVSGFASEVRSMERVP